MGKEAKAKKAPRGYGHDYEPVMIYLPVTFRYNPKTGSVLYPRPGKSASDIKDEGLIKAVKEEYEKRNSLIVKP